MRRIDGVDASVLAVAAGPLAPVHATLRAAFRARPPDGLVAELTVADAPGWTPAASPTALGCQQRSRFGPVGPRAPSGEADVEELGHDPACPVTISGSDPEAFQCFFESQADIPRVMQDGVAQGAPEISFYRKLDTPDEF